MQAHKPFEYTLNMETIFQGNLSKLKSFYCREDFESALADYDRAPADSKRFRKKDVSRLCKARDIDEEAFENDISLRSEFVRLALQDDSLSESERNRLISCGWNALNNRGAL